MHPLVLSRDPALLDDLARLAAGAGVECDVRVDPVAALASWGSAPLVLVGEDLLGDLVAIAPPRRSGVVVVCRAPQSSTFRLALELGAATVAELPAAEHHLGALLADVDEGARDGLVVGVIGGAGGAGASTVACALAQVGGRAGPTLLIDTDPVGPGLDRLLGVEGVDGVRWADLAASSGRLGARALREAVPERDGVGVLTWLPGVAQPPPLGALRDVLAAARRGHEVVVLDLARQQGEVTAELVARCDQVLAVTPATISGVSSTIRLLTPFADTTHLRLAVRRGGVSARDVADATGLPVAMEVPEQRALTEAVDLGLGPVRHRRTPLGRAAAAFLAQVA
ncbi:septum site-determining protein Ssd [Nocardioides piscis]|uniref:Septum site determining protein n=1 Tax=Nocardioides piscis TaxID=2714938 RepID=A0A6G7YDB3_9ACTN|nr:septum site-determining protein Ssd [Nocardioides piscis]QIK74628.1 septum site determining protein [Nocardioides piscis]